MKMTLFSFVNDIVTTAREGEGCYSIYLWVGRCDPAPHILTLFKTNIADFPTLFKTEFQILIPRLRHAVTSCVAFWLCNQWEFNVPGINAKVNRSQYCITWACKNFAVYRPRKDILFKTKTDKAIP